MAMAQNVAKSSRQKSRLLPTETQLMSEKALAHYGPQATFSYRLED
jgi:hypothetical protein